MGSPNIGQKDLNNGMKNENIKEKKIIKLDEKSENTIYNILKLGDLKKHDSENE